MNDVLAQHYGFPNPGKGGQLVRVEIAADQRQGFLGLSSFLTQTSFPGRTSPTLRGVWVLSELLCDPPPAPPANVPDLNESAPADMNQPSGSENVRVRLEKHRTNPACAACHQVLDPIGLGLERFDGVGHYRETYGNGDPIVPDGVLPDGTAFAGARELAQILAKDPRFPACVASKMFTYALGREMETFDAVAIEGLMGRWAARGLTFRNLMKEVVLSDAFRFRRGESE